MVVSKVDLAQVLEDLKRKSKAPQEWDLALEPWSFAHGDLSPTNIIVTSTAIAFLDFEYARLWPDGYERWTLETSRYEDRFARPKSQRLTGRGF